MSKSKQMKREYNLSTHTDAFTWLENSGECGQEVLKYIRNLERTAQIKAVQAVVTHFDNTANNSRYLPITITHLPCLSLHFLHGHPSKIPKP